MTIAELRILANWHEERKQLASAKLQDARNDGLSHAEVKRCQERLAFHASAANGLKQLSEAFSTLSALSDR